MGIALKVSVNTFHNFSEYLRLPKNTPVYTFVIKSIQLVNLCGFVIPPQKEEVLRIFYLIRHQQHYCFD